MKKIITVALIIFIILSSLQLVAVAKVMDLTINVDGKTVAFPDAKPYIDANNHTLVPVRAIAEALGANVGWKDILDVVTISKGDMKLEFKLNYTQNDINITYGDRYKEDTVNPPALLKDSRVYVPLRFICEYMGCAVGWDGGTRTISISGIQEDMIFPRNPAMPEGTYNMDGENSNCSLTSPEDNSEFIKQYGDSTQLEYLGEVKKLLESINNVDYRNMEANKVIFSGPDISLSSFEKQINQSQTNWYDTVISNTIVKEARFVSDVSQITITPMGTYTVRGKLQFIFHQPTSPAYLKSFSGSIETEKWYQTDVEVRYNPYNSLAGMRALDEIIVGKTFEPVKQ